MNPFTIKWFKISMKKTINSGITNSNISKIKEKVKKLRWNKYTEYTTEYKLSSTPHITSDEIMGITFKKSTATGNVWLYDTLSI